MFEFMCHHCRNSFEETEIAQHVLKRTCMGNGAACPICLKYFPTNEWVPNVKEDGPLKNHLANCVTSTPPTRCQRCCILLKSKEEIRKHLQKISCEFRCGHCGGTFFCHAQRESHARTCSGVNLQCRKCLQTFSKPDMVQKFEIHLGTCQLVNSCGNCGKRIVGAKNLPKMEMHTRNCDEDITTMCKICKKIMLRSRLHQHTESDHPFLTCPNDDCHLKFRQNILLQKHLKTCKLIKECKRCGTKLAHGEENHHAANCQNEAKCPDCTFVIQGEGDENATILRRHKARVHNNKPILTCKCCGEQYVIKDVHKSRCKGTIKCKECPIVYNR